MICITAASLRAQAFHPSRALLEGLLDDDIPAPGLAPHPTAWTVSLAHAERTPDGHIAFEAMLTVGWGPDYIPPCQTPLTLVETRHFCRLILSGDKIVLARTS